MSFQLSTFFSLSLLSLFLFFRIELLALPSQRALQISSNISHTLWFSLYIIQCLACGFDRWVSVLGDVYKPIEPQLIVFHSFNKHFLLCLSSYLRFPHSNIITKYSHSINVMFGIPPHIFIKRLFILRQMCAKYIKLCYEVDMSISKIY